jgi:hypothetical protein
MVAGHAFLNVSGPLKFAASNIAGNLSATSSGTLFQSAALTVAGTASLDAGANAITLTNAANNFTGAVASTNSGANNVNLTDSNALVLGTVTSAAAR